MARDEIDPAAWVEDMLKLRATGASGVRITMKDIVDRCDNPDANPADIRPTSPNTVDAFLATGIDPTELIKRTKEWFKEQGDDDDEAEIACEYYEQCRMEKIQRLTAEREAIINGEGTGKGLGRTGGTLGYTAGSGEDQVERERRRLEVSRRRQMQELEQAVNYEVMRAQTQQKQEAKMRAIEQRIEQQKKVKDQKQAEWREQLRLKEQVKREEDAKLEAEARRLETIRHQEEMAQARAEREEEKRRKKEAIMREQERRRKQEQAKMETQRILDQQAAELEVRKKEMERKDRERELAKKRQQEIRAKENEIARQKAEERRVQTLLQNEARLREKKELFEARERLADERLRIKAIELQQQEAEKRKREEHKALEQRQKFELAQKIEADRVQSIKNKAAEKERKLAMAAQERARELKKKKKQKELEQRRKLEIVSQHHRQQAWIREQTLQKIQDETDRAFAIKSAQQELRQKRREANLEASMQRFAALQKLEEVQIKGIDIENADNIASLTDKVFSPRR
ncbi:unnamed protein product [Pedinophyceae sp. YPF-701]|nr:unnamed protein product [Pedinophyceae sp. YPF-701]